jgi:hypothetical protein
MTFFHGFFSSTRNPKSDPESQQHERASGPETAPVKMNLDERMAFRRELLFESVRATLSSQYIDSRSYRFKVMRTDKRGHCYVVMLDMAPAFMATEQGRHSQLAKTAAVLTQNAMAKYGLMVGGVYWRVDETLDTMVASWAQRSPPALLDITHAIADPADIEKYGNATAEELAAFEAAWQKSHEIQIGNRTYSSDLAPLAEVPPDR